MRNEIPPLAERLHELLEVCRSSLVALAPLVERVGIPWDGTEPQEDWDTIVSTLYEQIVTQNMRCMEEVGDEPHFPKYGLIYPWYEGLTYINVCLSSTKAPLGPFIRFSPSDPEFLSVEYAVLNDKGVADAEMRGHVKLSESHFDLHIP